MPIVPGTRLGSYVVQDMVGQGAMGVVYRCYHAQLERTGAVKVLQGLSPDADSVARFRREAQAIAHMRHPNIVNVFDFGEFEGTPYMIVEFVEGGSLAGLVKSGPLDRKQMVGYLHGIASALDYAHSRGIVHRDVKPANVLLAADGSPILADFGLAKLLESSSIKSLTGVTTGTPAYMAPEQVTGSQVGPAADRYSLAVMAYEMLTGFLPFDQGGVLEVLYAQVHRTPDAPSARVARLGPAVDSVVMRGLAKDPATRWESCAAFVSALENALNQRTAPSVESTVVFSPPVPVAAPSIASPPVSAPRVPRPDATMVVAAPAAAVVESAGAIRGPDPLIAAHPPRSRRRMWVYIGTAVAAILLILLIGTGAYLIINRPVTFDVSRTTASPGDSLVVTASHLPQNQAGEIQLNSVLQRYPFHADGNGNLRGTIFLPSDLELGEHTLRLCWNGTCHRSLTLHVVGSSVAVTSPTSAPLDSPSPTTSPSAGSTSTPASTPKASSSPSPVHSASPSPKQSPAPQAYITLVSMKTLGNTVVDMYYFSGQSISATVIQGVSSFAVSGSLTAPQGSGQISFTTPTGVLPAVSAKVRICLRGTTTCWTTNSYSPA